MLKKLSRYLCLSATLAILAGCLPDQNKNQQTQKLIDTALTQKIAGAYVAAVSSSYSLMALNTLPPALSGQVSENAIATLSLQGTQETAIIANTSPTQAVKIANCGDGAHVVAYVAAGQERALGLGKALSGIETLRLAKEVQHLLPQAGVGVANQSQQIIGLNSHSNCRAVAAGLGGDMGQGPVAALPYKAITNINTGDMAAGTDHYRYQADPSDPCLLRQQKCRMVGDAQAGRTFNCQNATANDQNPDLPLELNGCISTPTISAIQDNTDLTAWQAAIASGTISENDFYRIDNGQVVKVEQATAEQLTCPTNPDATGIVINPQVTRASGWQNVRNGRVPTSNPNTTIGCLQGWQGALYAKYERRSCQLKKLTSSANSGAQTTQTVPENVFKLYYVAANCETATPVTKTATCAPGGAVTDSNGTGAFQLYRHYKMTQPVALTWTHHKNRSSSELAGPGKQPPAAVEVNNLVTLTRTVSGSGQAWSSSLAEALNASGALNKTTWCNVGDACDRFEPRENDSRRVLQPRQCLPGYNLQPDGVTCIGTASNCPSGSTRYSATQCEMPAYCSNGGELTNNCVLPAGTVPKVCATGDTAHYNSAGVLTKCTTPAVCPDGSAPTNGTCPSTSGTTTLNCPTGTSLQGSGANAKCVQNPTCVDDVCDLANSSIPNTCNICQSATPPANCEKCLGPNPAPECPACQPPNPAAGSTLPASCCTGPIGNQPAACTNACAANPYATDTCDACVPTAPFVFPHKDCPKCTKTKLVAGVAVPDPDPECCKNAPNDRPNGCPDNECLAPNQHSKDTCPECVPTAPNTYPHKDCPKCQATPPDPSCCTNPDLTKRAAGCPGACVPPNLTDDCSQCTTKPYNKDCPKCKTNPPDPDCENYIPPSPITGRAIFSIAGGVNASGSYQTYTCEGGVAPNNVCYNLLNGSLRSKFCSSENCVQTGWASVSGDAASVINQLKAGANNLPPDLQINVQGLTTTDAGSVANAVSAPAQYTVLIAPNFQESTVTCSFDTDSCYSYGGKKYCGIYQLFNRFPSCEIYSLAQGLVYQKGGAGEVRFYSSGPTPAGVGTPAVSQGNMSGQRLLDAIISAIANSAR